MQQPSTASQWASFLAAKEEDKMEDSPYTDEEMKELEEWLNKPYEAGEVHIPDSVKIKLHRLIATVDSLRSYNHLVEEEAESLKVTVERTNWDAEGKIKELKGKVIEKYNEGFINGYRQRQIMETKAHSTRIEDDTEDRRRTDIK